MKLNKQVLEIARKIRDTKKYVKVKFNPHSTNVYYSYNVTDFLYSCKTLKKRGYQLNFKFIEYYNFYELTTIKTVVNMGNFSKSLD